jgi:hypothetical protein
MEPRLYISTGNSQFAGHNGVHGAGRTHLEHDPAAQVHIPSPRESSSGANRHFFGVRDHRDRSHRYMARHIF